MIQRIALLFLLGAALLGDARAIVAIPPLVGPAVDDEASGPGGVRPATPPLAPPPAPPEPAANPLWGMPLNALSVTRERPIFSPSRRPPPRVVARAPRVEQARTAPNPVENDRPPLSLVGTVVGKQESIGVFVDDTTKEAVRLRTGEEHKGWVLRAVETREVTLEKNRATAMLALPQPGSQRTAAAPPPPPSTSTRNRRR
jgi:hypothetical protein